MKRRIVVLAHKRLRAGHLRSRWVRTESSDRLL
jgi:hypothetical protein